MESRPTPLRPLRKVYLLSFLRPFALKENTPINLMSSGDRCSGALHRGNSYFPFLRLSLSSSTRISVCVYTIYIYIHTRAAAGQKLVATRRLIYEGARYIGTIARELLSEEFLSLSMSESSRDSSFFSSLCPSLALSHFISRRVSGVLFRGLRGLE